MLLEPNDWSILLVLPEVRSLQPRRSRPRDVQSVLEMLVEGVQQSIRQTLFTL